MVSTETLAGALSRNIVESVTATDVIKPSEKVLCLTKIFAEADG